MKCQLPLFIMHKPQNDQHDQEEVFIEQCVSEFRGTVHGPLTDLLFFVKIRKNRLK